jgi:hypothetical protein
MHYFKDGNWLESQELIQVAADGSAAYAAQGPSQAIFSANANSIPCIDLLTSDSNRLQSHVLGLAYYDAASGKSVMIAATKDAVGQLLPPNQIRYPDAMTDFTCDIRYTYRKCGLEQDIILRQQPPPPQTFGLDPASTRLQVWTEFFDPPATRIQRRMIYQEPDPVVRQAMVQPDWTDDYLDFGAMRIGLGCAFSLDGTDPLLVLKEWLSISNRTCLVESLSYSQVKPSLDALPALAAGCPRESRQRPDGPQGPPGPLARGICRPFAQGSSGKTARPGANPNGDAPAGAGAGLGVGLRRTGCGY